MIPILLGRYEVMVQDDPRTYCFRTLTGARAFAARRLLAEVTIFDNELNIFLHLESEAMAGHATDVLSANPVDVTSPQLSPDARKDLEKIRVRITALRRQGNALPFCVKTARTEWLTEFMSAHPVTTRQLAA